MIESILFSSSFFLFSPFQLALTQYPLSWLCKFRMNSTVLIETEFLFFSFPPLCSLTHHILAFIATLSQLYHPSTNIVHLPMGCHVILNHSFLPSHLLAHCFFLFLLLLLTFLYKFYFLHSPLLKWNTPCCSILTPHYLT